MMVIVSVECTLDRHSFLHVSAIIEIILRKQPLKAKFEKIECTMTFEVLTVTKDSAGFIICLSKMVFST